MATVGIGEKIGEIFAEMRLKFDKLDADFKRIEDRSRQSTNKIEDQFSKIKTNINTNLMNKSFADVEKMQAKLRTKLEEKISMNYNMGSIQKTKTALDSVNSSLSGMGQKGAESTSILYSGFMRIGAAIATYMGIKKAFSFTEGGLLDSTKLKDLQEGFEGTARDIELMKKATAGMVSDGDLLILSNQAAGYNVKIKDQPILFLLAAKAAKSMGGTIAEGFDAIMKATDGMSRGVGKLVGGRAALNQEVERLARLEGGKLSELDAEVQKRIKIQAIINASHLSMADVEKNQATQNQQLQALPALIHEVKEAWGSMFTSILSGLPFVMKGLKDLARNFKEVAQGRAGNATETIIYDFKGTTEKDREALITQWQIDASVAASNLNKATADYRNHKIGGDEFEGTKLSLEIQISSYAKLIELARKYKEETKDTGPKLSADAIAAIAEKQQALRDKFDAEMLNSQKINLQKQLDTSDKHWQDEYNKLDASGKKEYNLAEVQAAARLKVEEKYTADKINLIEQQVATDELKGAKSTALKTELGTLEVLYKTVTSEKQQTEILTKILALKNAILELDKKDLEGTSPSLRGKTAAQVFEELTPSTENTPAGRALFNRSPAGKEQRHKDAEVELKDIKLAQQANENFARSMSEAFTIANMQGKNLVQIFGEMGMRFADMVVQALAFKLIMAGLNAIPGVGTALSWLHLAHSGGEFVGTGGGNAMKLANGANFIVPPGFTNDRFGPLYVETGERVTVTPARSVGSQSFSEQAIVSKLDSVNNSIHALTKITLQNREVVSNLYLDSKLLATSVTQRQNEFNRGNVKISR